MTIDGSDDSSSAAQRTAETLTTKNVAQLPENVPMAAPPAQLDNPDLFINRELSWLEFNARVVDEASSAEVPLYERLKFLSIFATNLDEFFMVRAAGLQAQMSGGVQEKPPDGQSPLAQLVAIAARAHELVAEQYRCFNQLVRPSLREQGIALAHPEELADADLAALDWYFERDVFPVLTPIAIDPAHPFPHLRNKAINVGFIFDTGGSSSDPAFGLVQVPIRLPRLIPVPLNDVRRAFVLLEDLILRHRGMAFPNLQIVGQFTFRVTRNFDIEIDDEEGEDLMSTLQAELRRRERGHAVRVEVAGGAPETALDWLTHELGLHRERDSYAIDGPLFLGDMTTMTAGDDRPDLRDEPFKPQALPPFRDTEDYFETIRQGDVLLHHPYESFDAVIDFLWQAAEDPSVLAIKQTLYRTGGESPMVRALQRASELGKQVTALVELKARFDEESNIQWARALERSGVNVMYGLLGFKTHAKVLLVVRQESDGLRRYVHLATGNYNEQTARLYEDISLFTAREEMGRDATSLFNLLTGYSAPDSWQRFIVAPLGLHEAVLGLIHRETANARGGKPARIVAKMNSLVDADVISALYAAAQAGVEIDLLIRGICCLRPNVPGTGKRIRVLALIDRFLEHARIMYFENDGEPEVFCGSADWMPRNFRRRVEVMFPIVDEALKKRLVHEVLDLMRSDNVKSWSLEPDGSYRRVPRKQPEVRSQVQFMSMARERAKGPEPILNLGSKPRGEPLTPASGFQALADLRRKRRRGRSKK